MCLSLSARTVFRYNCVRGVLCSVLENNSPWSWFAKRNRYFDMDAKELRFHEDHNDDVGLPSDRETADAAVKRQNGCNDVCYVNDGFDESDGCRTPRTPDEIESGRPPVPGSSEALKTTQRAADNAGYVNNAFEDGPQKAADKGTTVPRAHDIAVITSATLENQITKLDEDNNGVVAVNLEAKEKKRKIQSVGWDTTRSVIFFGLVFAFDVWAAVFYCFKTNVLTNIFN